jgi:23S rRNA (guanosine2251-2'-O)-methyltransferase
MKKFKKFDRGGDRRHGSEAGAGRSRNARHQQTQNPLPAGRCVVGIHAVNELLKVRAKAIDQLWIRDRYSDHPELKEIFENAKRSGLKVQTQAPTALDKVVGNNQGVMAFTQWQPQIDWPALEKAERATLIALDEVEDPHNLGAVMRTAWLFGAQGVLVPEHRSANLSPAVSKVAQGAVEHIPLEQETNLPQQLETLKKNGFWILGLSHKATQSLYQLDIPKKVVWVLGSESSGLRKSVEGACDDLISIPQADPEASYNVSVAAAVALSESFRQARGS